MGVPQSVFHPPIFSQLHEQKKCQEQFDDTIKIMTWNILAERLVTQSHFPYVNPIYLGYRYRIDITKRLIERMDCQILALQEVDPTHTFLSFLTSLGYEYRFRPKGFFQGILLAFKKDLFQVLQEKILDYDEMIGPRLKRFPYATGHGGLFLKLLFKGKYKIIIGNTHLHWVPKHYKVKYHQTMSALNEVWEMGKNDDCLKFLMGDFNSLPDCNCVKLVTTNEPPTLKPEYDSSTFRDMSMKYEENQHRLVKMTSAYTSSDLKYTNITENFSGIIDHMFYEESDRLKLSSLYTMNDNNSIYEETALPNRVFPSDHLPLICTFGLKSN